MNILTYKQTYFPKIAKLCSGHRKTCKFIKNWKSKIFECSILFCDEYRESENLKENDYDFFYKLKEIMEKQKKLLKICQLYVEAEIYQLQKLLRTSIYEPLQSTL